MDKKLKIVSECFGQSNVHAAIVVDEYVRKLGLPRSLEEVGVKPNIWYQLKVRNVDEEQIVANNDVHEEHEH